MPDIVRVEHLSYIYGQGMPDATVALDDISFSIEEGSFVGVIGSTGCGKSTLIGHFNGINRPTQGKVYIDGEDIWQDPKDIRRFRFLVGLVFQYPEYQLFEETVYKDISFGPKNMGLTEKEIDERVRQAAELVGLPDEILAKSPFDLSGGQKRRVAIAGVMAMGPQVLILDEPTAGLDPIGRDEIIANIDSFRKRTNAAVIMVSHSMEEMAVSADRLFVFDKGNIVMRGTPAEVFSQSEKLEEIGLAVPKVTQIAMRLREMGLDLPRDIYTVERMKEVLFAMKKGGEARD